MNRLTHVVHAVETTKKETGVIRWLVAKLDVRILGYGYTGYTYVILKKTHFGCFLSGFESFLLETFNTFEGNLNLVFPRENESFVTHG